MTYSPIMKSPKSILSGPAVLWSRVKSSWAHPLAPSAYILRVLMRKKFTDKGHAIFGIQVYLKMHSNLSKGLVVVQESLDLIDAKSPVLVESLKGAFRSFVLNDSGLKFMYFPVDKCLMINASLLPKIDENKLKISWASRMVLIARGAVLMKGRHGYIGIRYLKILRIRAAIRFIHRCIDAENHLYCLSLLNVFNKDIDKLRPKRRYYERFLRDDMEKWSFGKNLEVARDGLMIVEKEE